MKTHVHLRDVQAGDLALFFAHQQDPEAAAMAAFQSRDSAAFAQHWGKLLRDDTSLKQTIMVSSTGSAGSPAEDHVAGNIGSWNSDGKRDIGYWIDRAYWGRGVATAALSAFLRLEQVRPLHAGVAKHNAASLRVLEKCGFKFLRSADEESDAADDSHVLLVLTKADSI
ncbi:MAG: GNAT family N-acetyltransferase [Chthoniobacterales bacterium]|nr:GNAT family N-acetyltransferase [Chthoniobacterales bacterium]